MAESRVHYVKNAEGGGDEDEHFQKIQNEKDAMDLF